jgi:Na+/proline symporter
MPLSEHDQQVLAQIERDLYADAKLVKTLRSTNARGHAFRQLRRFALLFMVGLATLVFAVTTNTALESILLGLFGFIVMLLAALGGSAVVRRLLVRQSRSQRQGSRKALATVRSIAERARQRWQRRPGA